MIPPIDGVPFLLSTRACSPPASSALSEYSWPNFDRLSSAMIFGPSHQQSSSAVTAAPAVRKVMYWNTRRKESQSAQAAWPFPANHCGTWLT